MKSVNKARLQGSNVCERKANDLVSNDYADSKFSWNQQEVVHPLLLENTAQIFHLSRPPWMSTFA